MAAFPSSFHLLDSSSIHFYPQFYHNPIIQEFPFHNDHNPKKLISTPPPNDNNDHDQLSVSVLSVANTIKRRRTRQPKKAMREVKAKKQKKMEEKKSKETKKAAAAAAKVAPTEYVHVRAKRGQATDSHSLAERVRRERISERMKLLQALVPGCDKVTGKALMLDEIINYVQSLHNQVEFLSMKLASVNPMFYDFGMDLDPFMVGHNQDTTAANTYPPLLDNSFSTLLFQPTQILPNAITPHQHGGRQGLMWEMEDHRQKINGETGNSSSNNNNNNNNTSNLFSFH